MEYEDNDRYGDGLVRLEALLECLGSMCCRPSGGNTQEELARRYVSRIVIRFRDEFARKLPYEDDAQNSLGRIDPCAAQRWEALEKSYGRQLRLRPGITTLNAEQINGVVRLAIETARKGLDPPGKEQRPERSAHTQPPRFLQEYVEHPPNFLAYFFLTASADARKTRALLKDLRAWSEAVEFVYFDAPAAPPGPTTFDASTGAYVHPAPLGIGATTIDSAFDGSGVTVAVLEHSWWAAHSDLPAALVVGSAAPSSTLSEMAHGTATLGILAARRNDAGMSGLAPAATVKIASFSFASSDDLDRRDQRISDALMQLLPRPDAVGEVGAGDVLLIEAQAENRHTIVDAEGEWTDIWSVPAEQKPLTHDAIRTAAALQIIVVEPAGNYLGGPAPSNLQDLSDPLNCVGGNPAQSLDPSSPHFSDSGAIVVGAASSPGTSASRLRTSNFGNRIDCYAQGSAIPSCSVAEDGSGAEVEVLFQASASGRTSGASAIVAGAALLIQKMALTAPGFGRRLTPDEMRRLLRNVPGTPVSHNPNITPGGPFETRYIPNLAAIFAQLQTGVLP